ncbi:serine-type D-Ala-D-Ala carboxypeptidase [Streptococcus pseudoporcinus]|uniref:Serine-type D-Ala-D-Ala carboxypeptidase n=1 Tax=Streptococcus pseudoporcinus TaxID=361101 RepID=A0A4U9XIP8_9STRE|nr:serine hydrolase [Streptococcus pseudoporcinus]VTS12655.1 serine-type D-Ala-D-Ala carboxypeptidase [Streptococcus pseudoporcinus]VUC65311.1 serine-type D-Ala-D-Ala carboxypeptidase [Streptococcus pseudoporcinus]VUC96150.1 serine-type D-Ala-D-Ala carboxypeptidase [Streptococcus pseudoporcinus]VUC96546.1 serine-type D-Ala-D-Ala carboxypeptidase [Streptococcus pseudoporcinus]
MLKKYVFSVFLIFTFFVSHLVQADEHNDILNITREAGYQVNPINKPKSSIVVDASNGDILWQDNALTVRDPASMSKVFTLYLLFEDLAKGKITLDTKITASDTDQSISKIYEISNNKIVAGVDYPIRDLITMIAVPSSNAATVMVANYLSQNNSSAFLDRINNTAKRLGMLDTHFNNAGGAVAEAFNGYYNPKNYDKSAPNLTSAHDLAILVYHFLKKYPDIVTYTNKSIVKTMVGTPYEETFHSYNYSLPGDKYGLKGVDGLKTGSSPSAAFNAMVTAKRGKARVITIVMGVGDWADQDGEFYRHPFANALTEEGFKILKNGKPQKQANLFPNNKIHTKGSSYSYKENKKVATLIDQFESFVDHHHSILFLCLGLFIFIVILLAVIAIV